MKVMDVLQRAASTVSGAPLLSDSARCSVGSYSLGRRCYANVQLIQTLASERRCTQTAAAATAAGFSDADLVKNCCSVAVF